MTTLPPEQNGADGPPSGQPVPPEQPAAPQPPAAPEQLAAPQFEAPPAYEQPQQGYQAPPPPPQQPGYQQAAPVAANPVSTLQLNYWLSVFFSWIPALIFWLIEKDKGDQRATALHVANFNFSLMRTGVYIVIWIIGLIPYVGWIIALLLWLASIVLFVFHIVAAVKAPEAYRRGGQPEFIFHIAMVK